MIDFESALAACPLVAILRGVRPDEAEETGAALVAAGFRIIEVPLNSPDPFVSISRLVEAFGDSALVGAGTVLSADAVRQTQDAGGRLIVMPHADTSVVEAAKARGLTACPGAMTPTEAFAAIHAGADAVKLFPAEIIGVAGLKAMRAVLPPDVRLLPVGGITPQTMAPFLTAGAAGFGLGSALYKPGMSAADVGSNAAAFVTALGNLAA